MTVKLRSSLNSSKSNVDDLCRVPDLVGRQSLPHLLRQFFVSRQQRRFGNESNLRIEQRYVCALFQSPLKIGVRVQFGQIGMLEKTLHYRRSARLKEHFLTRKIIGEPAEYLSVLRLREIRKKTLGDE
jgi:hypothetical protein